MTRPSFLLAVGLAALSPVVACASRVSTGELLDRTVSAYNEHLRWKRFEKAATFLPDAERLGFIKLYEPSDELLNIDDLEIKDIDWVEQGVKAKVTVAARYFKLPSVTIVKKKWVQVWERHGEEFWIMNDPKEPFFGAPASPQSK